MKRNIVFLLALLCAGQIVLAQDVPDSVVIENANKVVVKSDSKSMSVDVLGKTDDPDYHFSKTLEAGNDGVNVSRESNSDFDFRLPFTNSSYKSNQHIDFNLAPTLSIGLVSALGGPSGLKTDFGKSIEITWHAFNLHVFPVSEHWHYSTGLWFNWKNYRMTGHTRFDKTDDGMVVMTPYPEHADIKFSRVHTLSYQIPLLVHYKPSKYFKFAAGTLLNFNGHGNLKTRYSLDDVKHRDRDRGVRLNSFTADIVGYASFKSYLGAYVKYSPFNVLNTDWGPKFHAISVGLIWDF